MTLLTRAQIDAIEAMFGGAHERLWYAVKARTLISHARASVERIERLEQLLDLARHEIRHLLLIEIEMEDRDSAMKLVGDIEKELTR